MRTKKTVSYSLPKHLTDWLQTEATAHGQSVSGHLALLLGVLQRTGSMIEIRQQLQNHETRLRTAGL